MAAWSGSTPARLPSSAIAEVVSRGAQRFTTIHRREDGGLFDVEASVNYLPLDGGRLVTFLRDITDRVESERAQGERADELIGRNMHWQIHGKRPDGTPFPVEYWSYPQFRDGAVVGAVVTFLDIGGRRRMEDVLRAKDRELDRYFSSSLDLLCIAGTDGRFVRLNPEWERGLGYSLPELEGHPFLDFVHPDDLQATTGALASLRGQAEVLSFQNRYRRKDGAYRWIEWRSHPQGELIYAAARDVTDRKIAEEKVGTLLEEKELILKEVHHRIKNNMGTIMGLLSLQAMSMEDPAAVAALEDAEGRVRSMKVLYGQTYESQVSGKISARDYLSSLVDDIVADFPDPGALRVQKDLTDFPLGPGTLLPLGLIVNELMTNVMKYAFAGRARALVKVGSSRRDGKVNLVIQDDGVGIPESVSFESSTGFGLKLVKELSRQLSGALRMERGEGTRFVLEFPGPGPVPIRELRRGRERPGKPAWPCPPGSPRASGPRARRPG